MKMLTLVLSLLTLNAFADHDCTFTANAQNQKVSWTAYKTPKKVGVKGSFAKFEIKSKSSKSVEDLLKSASFTINSQSVETGDSARDTKIMEFFFKSMKKGNKISGKVLSIANGSANVQITMNGKSDKVLMAMVYDETKNTATLSGVVDVMNFTMGKNLSALTKACMEKHEGKTWSDVNVEFTTGITKDCAKH